MITILHTENIVSRTFGWVQNPSDFRKLCNVVAVFDYNSEKHKQLQETILPKLVSENDGLFDLISALNVRPLSISYSHLVGTGKSIRSTAPCNAIIQAVVTGQGKKQYTDNWTADGFIRWAHCLGFISYNNANDTFAITKLGLKISKARSVGVELNIKEQEILIEAILSYPPAIRVLYLLSEENSHLTKFEIGKQLGFIGESGFTSMPQSILVRTLSTISNNKERNSTKANWEGSSDKYARMIASWLIKLGLVQKTEKIINVSLATENYTETIGQAYMITAQGLTALRRAKGASKHNRILKTICYEMLATKGSDREFLRTRRALIIKTISESKDSINTNEIIKYLENFEIITTPDTIYDDIQGFISIGLDIDIIDCNFIWRDKINDFIIPIRKEITQSENEQIKDELRGNIKHIPHTYLSLVDLAYDGTQSRLFEMITVQLLTEECGFSGLHLGGSRKPDGIVYTDNFVDNYGIIIDTKAYSGGYSIPISQADEMQRYIQENQRRDEIENPNKWWENFSDNVRYFYFMFVAGYFTGRYQDQINRICQITSTKGTAIEVYDLILFAESIKDGTYSLTDLTDIIFE
ncbi:MAG: hypothetical protein LBC73_04135 [Oscillospiraceae bacterium]|jgi:hypothetical protein|nr:hypothetical protein [Oscillospiraceae bacterium]